MPVLLLLLAQHQATSTCHSGNGDIASCDVPSHALAQSRIESLESA